jgi:hypothetical protein
MCDPTPKVDFDHRSSVTKERREAPIISASFDR